MQADQTSGNYVCEVLISSATLLAKDLVVDGSQIRRLLKVQQNQVIFDDGSSSIDDDVELLMMRKYLKIRNLIGGSKLSNKFSKSKTKINTFVTNKQKRIQNNMITPRVSVAVNNQYFHLLERCDDRTFQNQFKLTKKTFEV